MFIFKKQIDVTTFLATYSHGVGFVPTMGALHAGHISLLEQARMENPLSGCSIFVNPTQFNDPDDFKNYPNTLAQDIRMLLESHCDFLFIPGVEEMYPGGLNFTPAYDTGVVGTVLEGEHRPGHFEGVVYIVDRLLQIIQPANLYMGEKDFQQCRVIKKLLEMSHSHVKLRTCDTLREQDGLAMSSRNRRLSESERGKARMLYDALRFIKTNSPGIHFSELKEKACEMLEANGFKVEYISLADAETFELLHEFDPAKRMVVLAAVVLGTTRLIDNLRIG